MSNEKIRNTNNEAGKISQLDQDKKQREKKEASRLRDIVSHMKLSKDQLKILTEEIQKLQTSSDLETLKSRLEKNEVLEGMKFSPETIQAILDLIKEAKDIAQSNLENLKKRIEKIRLNVWEKWEPNIDIYPSSMIPFVQELEKSPLGKNLLKDITGVLVGSITDSTIAVFKLIFAFLTDAVRLPRDLYTMFKK